MMKKILKWYDYIEEKQKLLHPIMDTYSDRVITLEKKRDEKRRKRKEKFTPNPHRPLNIKDILIENRAWAKDKDRTPELSFVHQHIFDSINPYDIIDDLLRKNVNGWNAYNLPAVFHSKMTLVQRYEPPLDRTGIDKYQDPLEPDARCYNCGLFVQFKYKANKKIPKRTEKTVCQCISGQRHRIKMAELISQKREDWTAEKARKKRQKEKHERHIKRSAVDGN